MPSDHVVFIIYQTHRGTEWIRYEGDSINIDTIKKLGVSDWEHNDIYVFDKDRTLIKHGEVRTDDNGNPTRIVWYNVEVAS